MALEKLSSALEDCIQFFQAEADPAQLQVQDQLDWEAMDARLASTAKAASLGWASHEEGARAGILRQVVELGGVLATLASSNPPSLVERSMSTRQAVVFNTISHCCGLATMAGLSGSDLFRWARCGTALFSLGHRVLLSSLEHACQRFGTDSLDQSATHSFILLRGLMSLAVTQVVAAHTLLVTVWREPRILAAFAASVATPSDVVPWMALVATCINLAHDAGVDVQAFGSILLFSSVCAPMLSWESFSRHQAAMQQAPRHQEPLVKALPHILLACNRRLSHKGLTGSGSSSTADGSRRSGSSTESMHVTRVLQLCAAPCLGNALQRALTGSLHVCNASIVGGSASSGGSSGSSGEALALAQAVADLVRMVAEQPLGELLDPRERCELAVAAATAWCQLCHLLTLAAGELPGPLRKWAMTEALQMLPAVAHLAQQLRQEQGQDDGGGGDGDGGSYASAFLHVAAAVVSQARHSLGDAIHSPDLNHQQQLGPDTLAAVVGAAQASLLLLHFAAGTEAEQGPSAAGKDLATSCVEALDEFAEVLCSNAHRIGHLREPGMDRLEQALRQLLSTACRLAHFAAGRGEQWVAPDAWHSILAWLTGLFAACTSGEDSALHAKQRRQACAAAYLAAAPVALERCRGGQQLSLWGALDVSYNLQRAMRLCNAWLPGSQLRAPALEALKTICRMILQWPEEDEEVGVDPSIYTCEVEDLVRGIVGAAGCMPQLAAYLVGSGLMGELLHAGLHPPVGLPPSDEGYAGDLQHLLFAMLGALAKAAQEAAEEDASSPAAGLPAEVLAAAAQLSMQASIVLPGAPPVQPDAVSALYSARLHPLAAQLAPALEAHWQQRNQQAAAAVALAQAAATRGCAYLCCSNLGTAGASAAGPDAGQVPGSKRCGGCQVVRYCDERCSRADWHAGHRRVCRKLAAIRLAEAQRTQRQRQQQQQQQQQGGQS